MESTPSLETVFQALNALFRNPDLPGKEKASVWLGELQRSVYAWQISDQLLQLNQDVESCYFAAQTMRTKIQYAFHELPAESHQSLRDSLMNHCMKISPETPPAITTQLCLALADLALQMSGWKGAAADLMQKFGSSVSNWHFLLEVLTVLPEEINSRSLRLGANRRNEITEELVQACPLMLELLTAVLENVIEVARLQTKVYRCLSSWFSIYAIPQDNIINTKLLSSPFEALVNKDCPTNLHEAAADCICSALYAAEDLQKNAALAQALFQGVLSLPDAYHLSVTTEDLDKSINYCRVFTEMAESFMEAIVSTPNQGFGDHRTLEMLLTCVDHHQYEVAEITFNFWYRLSEMLYNHNNRVLESMFKPSIQRLIVSLCKHCQFDTDHEGIPDNGDEFVDFRRRVSDLVKDVVFIVGSSTIFSQMFQNLQGQTTTDAWEMSEASLFIMASVAKNVLGDESEVVPQVLRAVLALPDNAHIAVRYTSIRLVGELCEWIEQHPDFLDPVLQFLLAGLQQPPVATVAANSLQNISSQCRTQMTEHFSGLLQIVEAMDTFNVSNEAAIGLLKGTALILARMPADKITASLRQLCGYQISALGKIVEADNQKVIAGSKTHDPCVWLDRLAAIFRHINPPTVDKDDHPCQPVILEIWPVLSTTCDKYQADVRIIERCCRCIRFVVRCLGKQSSALLTPLVTQMIRLYELHQHSCFLYLASILVDEYGMHANCVQGLLDMLQAFTAPTFKLLEQENGLRNHPDTVDDLFRLCMRFTQRAPTPFLQCTVVKPLLCCAIAACGLDHREANASVTKFLVEFIKAAREKETKEDFAVRKTLVLTLLQEHGQTLVQALLNSCVFCLSSYMMPDSADVLYELMLVDRPSVCQWLEHALKSLPSQGAGGAPTATHKQLTDFHKTITIADEVKLVTRGIREFSRLFR